MTREELIAELLAMPHEIYIAEGLVLRAKLGVVGAKDELRDAEAHILAGVEDPKHLGPNSEAREARVHLMTADYRGWLRSAEQMLLIVESDCAEKMNRFRALRSVAALIAGSAGICG